jgi:membrane protease YdiL (CAAX protease family)
MDALEPPSSLARARAAGHAASRLWRWLSAAPAYAADRGDLRTLDVVGLRLPLRATIAVVAVALLLLLDYHGRLNGLVGGLLGSDGTSPAGAKRIESVARLVLLGAVPLGLVLTVMADRPSRYGLRLGDVRAGAALALGGCAVMTPVVLAVARLPDFAAYYAPQAAAVPDVVLTTALDVIPAEFFFRGFLLFALLRVTGPVAVVLATMPFAFAHIGKPELETLSTLGGGLLYGWLDWRTGSVLWSGLAHTWILALVVVAAGASI